MVDPFNPINAASAKLTDALRINGRSFIASPTATPRIGPISGEISMAPITTAVELIFNPKDAIRIAKNSTQILVPLNTESSSILLRTTVKVSLSFLSPKVSSNFKFILQTFYLFSTACKSLAYYSYESKTHLKNEVACCFEHFNTETIEFQPRITRGKLSL